MKKIIILLFIFVGSLNLFSQRSVDFGMFGGGSYYQGDLNKSRLFYQMHFSGGAFLRYNLNKRLSVRGNLFGGRISANDENFKNTYQQLRSFDFNTLFFELVGQMEFNFLPYLLGDDDTPFTPYIAFGLAGIMVPDATNPMQIGIPMEFGIKFNLNKDIGLGIAWNYRKTFTDGIDRTTNYTSLPESSDENTIYSKQLGYRNDNDWYSIIGVFLTFKVFPKRGKCHTYSY
jgi:hypothetical protein